MHEIYFVANIVSVMGMISNLIPRTHFVYKVYTTEPLLVNQYSTSHYLNTIYTNVCFLFYMIVYKLYAIIVYCVIIIILEISLLYMKRNSGIMKKSASQENLVEMNDIEMSEH